MYPFYLIFLLSKILASNKHNRFYFVTDKTIKKILKDDSTEPSEVELKEYTAGNDIATTIIWDKNVLKPESYFIDCKTFMNSDTETKLLLKCISNNNDEIFKFEIENKNGKLKEPNFYDTNDSRLNFKKLKKKDHVYFVSNREGNAESVKIYFEYMMKSNNLRSSCRDIIGKFYKFIKPIRTFRESITDFKEYNKSYVLKIWEAEKCVLGIINTLLKTLSTLSIPSANKLEFLKSYEYSKKDLEDFYSMMKSLKDAFNEEFIRLLKNNPDNEYLYELTFKEEAETILEDLKKDGSDSINQNYKGLLKSLGSLNLLVKGIMEKNAANDSITYDCDVETVDKFVKKYSSFLLEYCNILNNVDELFLNEFYYRSNEVCYRTDFKNLEQVHIDILIAKEMKKYLLNYENDKTDFLIFSQTDYFMNKLSERMNNNLKNLHTLLKYKDVIFTTKTRNMAFNQNSEDDIDCCKRIEKLQKKLVSVFNSDSKSGPQTFKKIIDNLDNKPVQNDIESSRINSDGVNLNANNMQLENQTQESLKTSEESKLNEDQNQELMQANEDPKLNEDQNQESTQSNEEFYLAEDKKQESTQESEEVKLNEDKNQESTQANDDPKLNEDKNQESTQENEEAKFNEDQNQESTQENEEPKFNEDQNQESTQESEEPKFNEDQNQESTQESEEVKLNKDKNQESTQSNDDPKLNEDKNQESTQSNEEFYLAEDNNQESTQENEEPEINEDQNQELMQANEEFYLAEEQNQESTQENEEPKLNEDQNQESTQENEEPKLNEDQNQESTQENEEPKLNEDKNQESTQANENPKLNEDKNQESTQENEEVKINEDQNEELMQANEEFYLAEEQNQESTQENEELKLNEDQNQESAQANADPKYNEDQNQESTQENEEFYLAEDQNQESTQLNEEAHLAEDQNQESTQENEDQTFDKNKLEENPKSSDSKFFIDEPKQINSDITNGTNLQLNNKNGQTKEQKLIKDIEVENKTKRNESKKLEGNDKEKIKALQYNKQNPKETLKQQNNKRNHDKSNKSNNQINDKLGQNERQIKSSENESNLGDDQKKINEKKINNETNPEKNNKITIGKQNDKSTFLNDYLIYIICGFAIASCILGVSIYYFRSS